MLPPVGLHDTIVSAIFFSCLNDICVLLLDSIQQASCNVPLAFLHRWSMTMQML